LYYFLLRPLCMHDIHSTSYIVYSAKQKRKYGQHNAWYVIEALITVCAPVQCTCVTWIPRTLS